MASYEYPPETGFGGIGTYTWHHARALARLGHEVHVLAGATEATQMRTMDDDGVIVHRFWSEGPMMSALDRLGRLRMWWSRQRLQNALSMFRGLRELQRRHRFDIIELPECGAEGALITRRVEIPTIVRLHSPSALIMPFYEVNRADIALCGAVERRAMSGATALTACSQFVANEVATRFEEGRPIRVITNGLDLDWSQAMSGHLEEDFDLPQRDLLILFVGRMEKRKGIHHLPRLAASILERFNVTLVLAGDDLFGHVGRTVLPYLSTRKLKGSIHMLGPRSLPEIRRLVHLSDVVLLPSLWENCPYSYLEAMAAGKAVVGSNQGGIPELITDRIDGLLADPNDVSTFIDRIEELIADASLRTRIGAAAKARIRNFHDATNTARDTVNFYGDLISGRVG